jgi:hypothetical protein
LPTLLNRPKGRPKERWPESVQKDLKIMGVWDWKKCVLDGKKMARINWASQNPSRVVELKKIRR